MSASWSFSFSCTKLNPKNFKIVEKTLKEFFDEYGLNYNEIVCSGKTEIECFNVDVYERYDFDEYSLDFLKSRLWRDSFIPFEYGAEIQESVPTTIFSEEEYQEYRSQKLGGCQHVG